MGEGEGKLGVPERPGPIMMALEQDALTFAGYYAKEGHDPTLKVNRRQCSLRELSRPLERTFFPEAWRRAVGSF